MDILTEEMLLEIEKNRNSGNPSFDPDIAHLITEIRWLQSEKIQMRMLLSEARKFVAWGLEYSSGMSIRAQAVIDRIDDLLKELP